MASREVASTGLFLHNLRLPQWQFSAGGFSLGFHRIRMSALIEAAVFFFAVLALDLVLGTGERFIGTPWHPFWLIVLFVTLQYGVVEAVITALLASMFLLLGNLPAQLITESMYDYALRLFTLPFLWTTIAVLLGSMRTRQLNERNELTERLNKAESATALITKQYNSLRLSKEQLEMRLAEERAGVLTAYEAAKSFEPTTMGEHLGMSAAKLVASVLQPEAFSLYRFDGANMRLEMNHGWGEGNHYSKVFEANSPLLKTLLNQSGKPLCLFHDQAETIFAGQGVMAGLIIDDTTGKLYGMLKIETMRFMDLHIRTAETFRILCEWIGRTYARAEQEQHDYQQLRRPHVVTKPAALPDQASQYA